MAKENVAEEAARANALANQGKTTVEEMLDNYAIETITLKSGRVFDVELFLPESLMLNLNSPLVKEFIEEGGQSGEDLYHTRVPSAVTNPIFQMVASQIVSMRVSMQPQWECPEGVVSITRFTLDEIREIFQKICVLSGAPVA